MLIADRDGFFAGPQILDIAEPLGEGDMLIGGQKLFGQDQGGMVMESVHHGLPLVVREIRDPLAGDPNPESAIQRCHG